MKNLILIIAGLLTSQLLMAQVPISTARSTSVGQTVTITGVVSNGAELGPIRYMQDATGGIPIYDSGFGAVVTRGDSVTVTGELVLFGTLLEIVNVTSQTVHASNQTITPLVVTPSGMGPSNEGELVQINNVTFANQGGTFVSGTLSFTDANGVQSSNIYLSSSHSLIGTTIPQTPVNITGLSSQFSNSPQLILRDANDIVPASSFFVTSSVEQMNLTASGFDLSWTTNTAGSSNIIYGTDAASMTTHAGSTANATNHSVALTGLSAGQIYYARAYSVSGPDTAWAAMGIYATVSTSSGVIDVYFNQIVDNSVSTGTNAQYLVDAAVENKIISYIDNAQTSIDVTIYNINRTTIVTALNNAVNRGVQVRLIADNGTANLALQTGSPAFNWFTGNSGGLMHNKFMVIDVDSPSDCWVFMGSMNFTSGEIFDNYNSFMFIQDQSLAKAYELEFEEMWGTTGPNPGIFSKKLGSDKTNNTPHKFIIGGIPVECYFSPSDGTTSQISAALQSAESSIEFALLTFTRNDLRDVLIAKHNAGVNVRGMIENINDTGGEFPVLTAAGVSVKDHIEQYLLHHKYGIIDADMPSSDPIVVVGCHNWTAAAESNNDENTLIIHDATIANLYTQEFNARWMGMVTKTNYVVAGLEGFEVEILGNPAQDVLNFSMKNDRYDNVSYKVFNTAGQLLQTNVLNNINGTTQHQLNINSLTSGSYIILFEVEGAAIGKQFIVTK
jgi:phosphatidylserine/phosphatidylglycerophosphate/cardiolipin synthase-like enzyme